MQERKALGTGRTLGRKPDFGAQLSPGLWNRAQEKRPGSLDPELLGGERLLSIYLSRVSYKDRKT